LFHTTLQLRPNVTVIMILQTCRRDLMRRAGGTVRCTNS
jgi:hypothetical protein